MRFTTFIILILVFIAGFSGGFYALSVIAEKPEPSVSDKNPNADDHAAESRTVAGTEAGTADQAEVIPPNDRADAVGEGTTTQREGEGTLLEIPFVSQAPLGDWSDPRQQDGCEEASAFMAVLWARNEAAPAPSQALKEIIAISEHEKEKYGSFHDTSAKDTGERILNDYFGHGQFEVKYDFNADDIKNELALGHPVIVPADGRKLGNPFYTPPGPERHMLIIKGYDPVEKEFITNDPGTRQGKDYRYGEELLFEAIKDYPTGNHEAQNGAGKAMIVIFK
ncbi:MAG: C39 family peptidase [Candidatus Falkowbacteria bacterium]